MSLLDELQKEQLLEQAIQELLAEGVSPTPDLVEERFSLLLESTELEKPGFSPEKAVAHTASSASQYNRNTTEIKRDLDVLYGSMLQLSELATDSLDRWRFEVGKLEAEVDALDDRVDGLLAITRDTAGYINFVSDNFVNTEKIDLPNSSVVVDLGRGIVTMGASNAGATRVFLNSLADDNFSFTAVTQKSLQAVVNAPGSELRNAFDDTTRFWQSRVFTNAPGVVVGELKVKLAEVPVAISRISIKLHAANSSSSIHITPLYSVDNFEFKQLPTTAFSLSVVDRATFSFESVDAKYIKFVMVKEGYDTVDGLNYVYEFGAEEISFFSEGFEEGASSVLFSRPLSVKNPDGAIADFNRATLEACEFIPEDTTINFSVAATTSSALDPNTLNWAEIDPIGRLGPTKPVSINFADLPVLERGVSGGYVKVSYDQDNDPNTDPGFSNPAAGFTLLDVSAGAFTSTTPTATGVRYNLPTNNDRILDHQIKTTVPLDLAQFTVLRNLGVKGNKDLVRGVQSGWAFADPYYQTVIEVKSKEGQSINFGEEPLIVDGVSTKGVVTFSQGFHQVRVHKDNWLDIANNLTTLAALKAADLLYPFNHKLLIEGYQYDGGFTEEKVYTGVDLFAEFRMKQVSPFDLLKNVSADDYSKFALDLDTKDGSRNPSRVILVKSHAEIPDFKNERFVIRIKVDTNSLLFKYIWLKAEFKTNTVKSAPALESYRIRLGR